jgi:fatty-acyl-CoA synthase
LSAAVIVPKPGAALDEAAVLAHCARQLASFKVPKSVLFVDALPKNPSGKLLKRELRLAHQGLFAA